MMTNTCIKSICLGLAIIGQVGAGAQSRMFSAAQIREDLQYVISGLRNKHPNLYLYAGEQKMNAFFDSLMRDIPPQMSAQELYNRITPLCNVIGDGHTLIFPADRETGYHNRESVFFPFRIYWKEQRMFVELNYGKEMEITDGTEILEINGAPVSEIMAYMLGRMMRDGYNQTYPVWVLNNWFNEYYSYFYGHPESFSILYRTADGKPATKTVRALKKSDIFANRVKNYPDHVFEKKPLEGITLEIKDSLKTALLVIRDFHKSVLKKTYRQDFAKTLGQYFARIRASGAEHLVLDIRNNQGGDIQNGRILLSYLMDRPFSLVSAYYKVRTHEAGSRERLRRCGGPSLGLHKPRDDAFKGQLIVLINGGSFSNSGIVSSALQFDKRAVFIGEESGGNGQIISGDVTYRQLPNTKIKVEIPRLRFVMRQEEQALGQGIAPDYAVSPAPGDLAKRKDTVLDFALELIKKSL